MEKLLTGLDECLRILLSCFRARNSAPNTVSQSVSERGFMAYGPALRARAVDVKVVVERAPFWFSCPCCCFNELEPSKRRPESDTWIPDWELLLNKDIYGPRNFHQLSKDLCQYIVRPYWWNFRLYSIGSILKSPSVGGLKILSRQIGLFPCHSDLQTKGPL